MELVQLKYFTVLAKQQHFTRAAESLHITQPALSRAISNLEEELGLQLFDRVGKQVYLNSAGQTFLEEITPILGDLEDAKARMTDVSVGIHGSLCIGSTILVETSSILQRFLRGFIRRYPAVSQRIYIYAQAQIERLLLDRQLDFGVSLSLPTSAGITAKRLFAERLGIVVGKTHPLADRDQIHLKDVAKERFLCTSSAPDNHDTARFICKHAGFDANVVYEGNDTPLISQLVAEGYGVTLMPEEKFYEYRFTTQNPVWQKNLRFLPVEDNFCIRPIYLFYRDSRYQSAICKTFLEELLLQIEVERGSEPV